MKIGIVSDTHSRPVPKQLMNDLKRTDLIIHAGDFCSYEDYVLFSELNDIKAVYGNVDELKLRKKLPRRLILEHEGVTIGVYHGDGPSHKVVESIKNAFKNDKIDVFIFGHTHHPMNEQIENILYFNPGSPTDLVIAPYRSYGILEVKNGGVKGKIIKIKD